MSIPWVTALQVARKFLPVVVDNAPELLKTLSQLRATVPVEEQPTTDPILTALHQQIDAHRQTIAVQANTIDDLSDDVAHNATFAVRHAKHACRHGPACSGNPRLSPVRT